ncbi:50S ribosomal protein L11 methyltransferase [Marichromatium gracile]|uniref:Ribosomal protein L11 methyltransferase n=1 Tax=Marichromatium gracile TaxID=1048 RepID=A0ABR5VGH4_MARGR|nr:50S ribosomal protein L11 methyltransferase [Marichromatium gracile]KXX64687.1 ribosomal protein L11 methyltransferase [Marichromatium gracile]
MPWLQLRFDAPREQAERLAIELEEAGALSVTFGDAGDEPQLEPGPGETPLWTEVTTTALFEDDETSRALVATLAGDLGTRLTVPPQIERLEDQVWERVWLDTFKPTRFGQRLWVCPHGQSPEAADAVVVALDPGLAFGTGHHATTALCLEWLDGADLAGKTVLDYGCGSGILAIAALKLGAARAVAVDHDPQALQATRDNAAANGVAERIECYLPDEQPEGEADIVLANILAGPLVELAPRLIAAVGDGGALVLSGVLAEQAETVRAAYAETIALDPTCQREDWVRISGRRST